MIKNPYMKTFFRRIALSMFQVQRDVLRRARSVVSQLLAATPNALTES